MSSHHSREIHEECWHRACRKKGFFPLLQRYAGRCWLVTRLSCYSFDYTRNVSPPPLSVFDFPLRGEPAGQRYDRHGGAKEGSSCKHHFHWCALKWTKKSGDAYAIRAETLSDLIFVRGFSHSPERVLLIHFPRPSRRRYGLYSDGWQNDMPREGVSAFALITRMIFSISHRGNSGGQRDKYSCIKETVSWFGIRWEELAIGLVIVKEYSILTCQAKWNLSHMLKIYFAGPFYFLVTFWPAQNNSEVTFSRWTF